MNGAMLRMASMTGMLILGACTSTASTSTTLPASTTVAATAPLTTTTTIAATTTSSSSTTTSTSTTTTIALTIDTIEVDLTTPCGVVEGWLAYASIDAWAETWDLTHPFTQAGPPSEDGTSGYGSLDNEAYQDETGMTAATVGVDLVDCSFADFGTSFGESVGVATVTGNGDAGVAALAVAMRTEAGQWKVDNFAGHVSIVSPDPFGEPEPGERVVFATPLGTFDSLVIVDGTTVTAILVENPVDPEEGIGTWVPPEPFGSGHHVVTVATMLENGILSAQAVLWTLP